MNRLAVALIVVLSLADSVGAEQPRIVAAENMYADIARQIAGPAAAVSAILANPDQDPHEFEPTAATARAVAGAQIAIMNGAGYDGWMLRLIGANPDPARVVIDIARIMHAAPGANPHLWYDPATMPAFARALASHLGADAQPRLAAFLASLAPLDARIAEMERRWAGTPVAATEPVFGDMAAALGLTMREGRFQLAVMNDTEPSAADVATFERDLRQRRVRVLIYNRQATDAVGRAAAPDRPRIRRAGGCRDRNRAGGNGLSAMDDGAIGGAGGGAGGWKASVNAVELAGVTLTLGGHDVLSDVTVAIGGCEFIGVLGPNGAGKTTLMRALLGLLRPRRGSVRVLDRPASRGNRRIGYMPQARAAPPRLSGLDMVASAAGGHNWGPLPSRADRAAARRAIALVDAEELAERPVSDLSGGERQRLLLAQALVGAPRLLLLDEPLISLDPRRQQEVVALARRVQRELAITVLFSAHELNPLLGALDRILYLGGGHAALGTVDEVITGDVLSRLYGAEIEVVRVGGRVFVMSGGQDVERTAHLHEHC